MQNNALRLFAFYVRILKATFRLRGIVVSFDRTLFLYGVKKARDGSTVLCVKRRGESIADQTITDETIASWLEHDQITAATRTESDPATVEVVIPHGARTEVAQESFVELFNNMEAGGREV
jgi:hypothetical protein